MSRIRSIHPGTFTDDAFMGLPIHAKLLLIGIWTEADDQGVFAWKPRTLKARLLPNEECDVEGLLGDLTAGRFVKRFEHSDASWGAVRNFRKFQRPQKPTAINPLPDELRSYVCLAPVTTVPLPEPYHTPTVKSPQMEDGGGRREDGESKKASEASASANAVALVARPAEQKPEPDPDEELPLTLVRAANADWSAVLFRQGLSWLGKITGTTPDKQRPLLGKWLKSTGGDHKRIFDLLASAQMQAIADPRAWITAALAGKGSMTPAEVDAAIERGIQEAQSCL